MLPTQDHIMAAQLIWGAAFKKVPRGRKVCLSQFAFYLCILIFPTLNLLTISSQVMMMSKENELQNDISSLNLCNNSAWNALWRLCSIHFVCYAVFYWLTQEARSSIDKRQTLWMWTHSLSHISHILRFHFSSNYSIPARINKSHSPIFIYWKWTVFKRFQRPSNACNGVQTYVLHLWGKAQNPKNIMASAEQKKNWTSSHKSGTEYPCWTLFEKPWPIRARWTRWLSAFGCNTSTSS